MAEADLRFVGENVRRHRKRQGMTQQRLAEGADLSVEFISGVERHASMPSIASLARIADVLGVELAELVRPNRSANPGFDSAVDTLVDELRRAADPRDVEYLRACLDALRARLA